MGMDTTCVVMDGDGLISRYGAGLYTAPAYLTESLQLACDVDARRRLRSAASMTLVIYATHCSTLGDKSVPGVSCTDIERPADWR